MKSPITNKEMKLIKEKESVVYKDKTYIIEHHSYLCEDTGEKFTTDELDEINIEQVYKQAENK